MRYAICVGSTAAWECLEGCQGYDHSIFNIKVDLTPRGGGGGGTYHTWAWK